jgi:hypothetical protein
MAFSTEKPAAETAMPIDLLPFLVGRADRS